ncbi:MAG: Mut7-C RNAse domain-containing protein [Haloferacaceae archaeon]
MTRFLLDTMLGKLATYLRMCGHDAAYALDRGVEDDALVRDLALAEDRTLLTRDEQLAARTDGALLLTAREIDDQLAELHAAGVRLTLPRRPRRCGTCNAELEAVGRDEPTPDYAPDPGETDVWRCPDCGQHFWKGSHWDDVRARLERVATDAKGSDAKGSDAKGSDTKSTDAKNNGTKSNDE